MSTLLTLPLELREQIYSYLTPPNPLSYPFFTPPITSISHRPPPLALRLTCHAIHAEIHAYFWRTATLTFCALHVPFSRDKLHASALHALQHARKVEITLLWNDVRDALDVQDGRVMNWPYVMYGWLRDVVKLLCKEGSVLERVGLVVCDASEVLKGRWKVQLLEPLEGLKGRVRFEVKGVWGVEGEDADLRDVVEGVVRQL